MNDGTTMIQKMLVSCPSCEGDGRRHILGEVKEGFFVIMKSHDPVYGLIKIRGEFEVLCGVCQEPTYFKTIRKEEYGTNNGTARIYRKAFVGTVVQNSQNNGTALGTVI